MKFENVEQFVEHFNLNECNFKVCSIAFINAPGIIFYDNITAIKNSKISRSDVVYHSIKFYNDNTIVSSYEVREKDFNKILYEYKDGSMQSYKIRDLNA